MKPIIKPWTDEDVKLLEKLIAKGLFGGPGSLGLLRRRTHDRPANDFKPRQICRGFF